MPAVPPQSLCFGAAGAAAFAYFVSAFDPHKVQWGVESTWVLSIFLWFLCIRAAAPRPMLGLELRASDFVPLAVIIPCFVAAWLPFYDDWRWAYTGDSIAWYSIGGRAAKNGLHGSLLSVLGVDHHFTYMHSLAVNAFMFVFEPNLFWHRVGKLLTSCLSLTAIYTFFATTLGRWWATAVTLVTATNYVWIWFTYVSYGHIDTYVFYFGVLTAGTAAWRRPDRLVAWMLCGLIGGAALFFTQTSWSGVVAVGASLALLAIRTRRFGALALAGASFLIVATPIVFFQFDGLLQMTQKQAKSNFELEYLWSIFRGLIYFPFWSPYRNLGITGGMLRPPLDYLYVGGAVMAALGLIPRLRRALRIPPVAAAVIGLVALDVILMTITNNNNPYVSSKRAFSMIPSFLFLALLPFIVLHKWVGSHAWGRFVTVPLVALSIGLYCYGSFAAILDPAPGQYGVNVYDGLIELRQRHPEQRVLLLTTRADYLNSLHPDEFFHQQYSILDNLEIAPDDFHDDLVARACREKLLLCCDVRFEQQRREAFVRRHATTLEWFPLLNSREMYCYACRTTTEQEVKQGTPEA